MIKVQPSGAYTGAKSLSDVIRALAQGQAAMALSGGSVSDLTDNSGGTAGTSITFPSKLTATDNDGGNLATKAASETALTAAGAAFAEVLATANTMMALVGGTATVDSSGMPAVDGTVAAIADTVAGAVTGCSLDGANAVRVSLNNYMATTVKVVNGVCAAVGVSKLQLTGEGNSLSSVPALSLDTGTAADPAVSAADMGALLTAYGDAVATMAAKLTEANAISATPKVLAV